MLQFNSPAKLMRRCTLVSVTLLICFNAFCQTFPIDTIMRNGNRDNRINIAYLSDGYQSAQLTNFITNSTTINNTLFGQTPFVQYKNFFNSFCIKVPSNQSGAVHPRTAGDCPSLASQPIEAPVTYYNSTFDFGGIHRLLVPQNSAAINMTLAENLPDFNQCFVVVNSPYYGGSGGSIATGSVNTASAEVAIHEIGHSFAGLADEYWAGDVYAAEKPNMTANNNPATVKWKNWMGINGIGIYLVGTTAGGTPWYRPHQNCKMQVLGVAFCSVCSERIIDRIHQLVNMIDVSLPSATSFTLQNADPVDFSVTPVLTNPSTIGIKWYLNGSATPFATNVFNVSIPYNTFTNGANTVRAEVIDNTTLSKSYLPGVGYINNRTWNVTKPTVVPVFLASFTGKVNNHTGILNWQVESAADLKSFGLEKSKDGISFSHITTINGKPQSTDYSYNDRELYSGNTYYRLKINDRNGSSFYSPVINLEDNFDKYYYKVYQQAEQKLYHLSVRTNETKNLSFEINDVNGKRIMRKDFGKVDRQLEFDFNLSGKPAGIYFMSLRIDNSVYPVQLVAN